MFKEEIAMKTQHTPVWREIKALLQAAIVVYLFTVVVGILNGLDLVEFDRKILVTHVHTGALGWITLAVFGACFWQFSKGEPLKGWTATSPRWLTPLAIASAVASSVAFYTTFGIWRPISGAVMFIAIGGVFAWVILRSRDIRISVPHLALLGAMANLTIGAIVGILLGLQIGGTITSLPEGIFIAHPATMLVGYVVLAGMAIAEWWLVPDPVPASSTRWGIVQVAAPFLGGLSLTIGAVIDSFPLIVMNVPLEILGVLIFLARLRRRLGKVSWLERGSQRLYGLSVLFVAVNVGLLAYLIVTYAEDFERIPPWLIFALDHAMFIGVMTNGIFGMIYDASAGRRAFWPWADDLLFWGMNIGLLGFVVGLIRQSAVIKQIFSPIMGASILAAMITYTIRLRAPRGGEQSAEPSAS
jgi:putative effector of murein hydrolase LrgA (UPF0299 family)